METTTPRCINAGLAGNMVIDFSETDNVDVGECYHWQQRYFTSSFGIQNEVNFRKREKQSGFLPAICGDWALSRGDYKYVGEEQNMYN